MANRPTPPTPPSFPPRLSSASNEKPAAIWESADNDSNDSEELELDFDEDQLAQLGEGVTELLDEEFKADIKKLEDQWYKEAARLSTYLVSPIHDAAAKGNIKGLEEFIVNQHQSVDSLDHTKNTPLHYSAGAGHVDAVAWLLDHGANINALNLLGDTALHRAVWRRHLEVVRLLCAKGIDRHVVNKQGHSVIDLVRDVDIGAEIQSYDPIEEPNLEEMGYEYEDDGGEEE